MMVLSAHAQILSRGVTKELAEHRKANISNVIYDLTLNIPADMNQKVTGSIVICFDLKKTEDIILDFQGEFNGTCSALIPKNKKKTKFKTVDFQAAYQNEHIIIPKDMVVEGSNRIELSFTSLDKGTHVISYDVYVTAPGKYSVGIATAQCQYAPQVTAHSAGSMATVEP